MAFAEVILKLQDIELSEKQEHYITIAKLLSENSDSVCEKLECEHVKTLCYSILDDFKKETNELPQVVKLLQSVFQNKYLQKLFPESEKQQIVKDIINIIDCDQHENVLVNCFSALIQVPSTFKLENSVLNGLLERMVDILAKKKDPASTYVICVYFQRFLKECEEQLSSYLSVLSKLVFLPLCHPSEKVREVAEKNLDAFPKILLYTSDEEATSFLLKLVKEIYSKDLLLLFKEKQELYVLKVWKHVVNALGSVLPANLPTITSFFQVIERGFKSSVDEICIAAFVAWKSLIDNFAAHDNVLNESRKLRFILKPFKNISKSSENILSVVCDTWMHLAWNLAGDLSNRFTEVGIPLLELTIGKMPNGLSEKSLSKGGSLSLLKKSCFILLRFLEQPPSESFNRLSSPKKLPHIQYPSLQKPLDVKVIVHHFKEILHVFKHIIDTSGTKEDMKPYLDCIMKSVLFIVSSVIEDLNKESSEAVTIFLSFLTDIIEAKTYSSLACLKCLESLSKLPKKVLVSHCFNCGSRKTQDILCTNFLKLLLNPHLFPSEAPKRFFAVYNRLVQAGIQESFHPLLNTQKFLHIIRNAVGSNTFDVEVLIDTWSGVATPLLEVIEKTQEVNQGDKQEHDFSCMQDALTFPFEFIFPLYVHQFKTRPAFKLWTNVYKAFIRSASLVPTTSANEACEKFCFKLKNCLKEDLLKKPHFFETLCLLMQSIIESIDFVSGNPSGTQGISEVALMVKRKKPLGNLTSFVDLMVILLKTFHAYIESDDDSIQSNAPAIQRKLHIVKNAAVLDILKTFFGNIKSGAVISYVLEQLMDPLSLLFVKSSQKRNLMNYIDSKLEMVWNVITSTIERYYLGPYDTEFLTLMGPILEATFSHPKRNFKEKSRRFWFATFAPNSSSLKFPNSLKNVLKKMKLPLLPDDISPTELSISPLHDSISGDSVAVNSIAIPKPSFISPKNINGETPKSVPKEDKQSPKISIDDLPSQEFVKINTPIIRTPKRRNVRKRKSFVPTLYNDLSQDTATMISSESQDTLDDSAPLEQRNSKESVIEMQATINKEIMNTPSASQKDTSADSKVINSASSAKFEEKLNENLIKGKEIVLVDPSPRDNGNGDKNRKSFKLQFSNFGNKNKNDLPDKISVFSKPGEKLLASRNTRRNSKLSQSFSFSSSKKESEKLEYQKLSKSCIEVIDLSDSEDIIPSSQEESLKNENDNELQKTKFTDKSNCDVTKQVFPVSPVIENLDLCENDLTWGKSVKVKMITSTPLKSTIPEPINKDKVNENLLEIPENISESSIQSPINILSSEKSDATSVPVKVLQKHSQEAISKPSDDKNAENQCNPQESIKDLNFLLDAVDDLVKVGSVVIEPVNENFQSLPDVEMKAVPESEVKTVPESEVKTVPESEVKITSVDSSSHIENEVFELQIAESGIKDDSQKFKTSHSSPPKENYSQRLRKKKNVNAITKSKVIKKRVTRKNANLNETAKKIAFKTKILQSQNEDINQICAVTERNEKTDKEMALNSELPQIDDMGFICSGKNVAPILITEQNIENPAEVVDNLKLRIDCNQNSESCEIFNSFKDTENNDNEINSPVDMNSLNTGDSNDNVEPNESESECLNSEIHKTSENNCEAPSDYMNVDEAEDINITTIIPYSLEMPNNFSNGIVSKQTVTDCEMQPLEPSALATPSTILNNDGANVKSENSLENEPSSVQFRIIEDELSCEMQSIINSVIEKCSHENLSDDLFDKEPLIVNKDEVKKVSQFPTNLETNVLSNITDEKSDLSVNEQKECSLSHSEIIEKASNNGDEFRNNSFDMVNSNKPEDESVSSVVVVENSNVRNIELNRKNNETSQEKLPENSEEIFSLKLDHSYSVSEQHSLQSIESKEKNSKCNVTEKDEIIDMTYGDQDDKVFVPEKSDGLKTFGISHAVISSNINVCKDQLLIKESINISKENEIKGIIKDLLVQVERLDCNEVSFTGQCVSIATNSHINLENSDSYTYADKENQISDIADAKGSKKRKIKPPIRSPFNFRQRSKIENQKKLPKGIKSLNISQIKSVVENNDLVTRSLYKEDDLKNRENAENSMAKIISSIVDSVTCDDDELADKEIQAILPSASNSTRATILELSNDELTDLNTRLNASIAPQTRRSKMIAASHTTTATETTENEPMHSNVVIVCSENSTKKLSSILKKRKSSMPLPPAKIRKVTFAHPLISEVLIENIFEKDGNRCLSTESIKTFNRKTYKIFQEKNKKTTPMISTLPTGPIQSEDVPSSSEYQDSDVLDFSDLPVSPALINCPDDISHILKDLTSPSWIQGLKSLLVSKNIKTIGDVCKLNIHQVKALPFKSPKVLTLHKALMTYINSTQETTLQKIKTIDDGSFGETDSSSSNSSDPKIIKNSENLGEDKSKPLEEAILEVLKKERLKELPLNVLGQLIEACGKAVIEKHT